MLFRGTHDVLQLFFALAMIMEFMEIYSAHSCFNCTHHSRGYEDCHNQGNGTKIVDFSGLCGFDDNCMEPFDCSHQLGNTGEQKCLFDHPSNCSEELVGSWPALQCDEQTGICQCPKQTDAAGPLDTAVLVSAYAYTCSCNDAGSPLTALDVRVQPKGWQGSGGSDSAVALVMSWQGIRECYQFRVSGSGSGSGGTLQFDCPRHKALFQGQPVSVQVCAGQHTASYLLNLPLFKNIERLNRSLWEPVVMVHKHRADRLVFSVQRPPPALCAGTAAATVEFSLRLVYCRTANCSHWSAVPGTERTVQEACSESAADAGMFRVEFDHPEEAGLLALHVAPRDGRLTRSIIISYDGKNTAQMVIVIIIVLMILLAVIAGFVWIKFFREHEKPKTVDVLIVYNRNGDLARKLAACLENHCLVRTRLDIVHFPQAASDMDPAEWLHTELTRCRQVLLLVFPETAGPPVFLHLYRTAVHHLKLDAGKKQVVIGYAEDAEVPQLPKLAGARRCRLPGQLEALVRAVRGAPRLPAPSWYDAHLMTARLRHSPEGKQLEQLLRQRRRRRHCRSNRRGTAPRSLSTWRTWTRCWSPAARRSRQTTGTTTTSCGTEPDVAAGRHAPPFRPAASASASTVEGAHLHGEPGGQRTMPAFFTGRKVSAKPVRTRMDCDVCLVIGVMFYVDITPSARDCCFVWCIMYGTICNVFLCGETTVQKLTQQL